MGRTKDIFLQYQIEEHYKQQKDKLKTEQQIMGGRTSERSNQMYYTLKSKAGAKDTETPHFALVEKKGDTYVTAAEYNEMFGRIVGASIKTGKTSQGKEIKSFILLIDDGSEVSNVQFPYSNLAFSMVNALSSLSNLSGNFTFYVDKAQKDKYWNARLFINQDEQRVSWKYKYEEYPHPEPVMIPDPSGSGEMIHFETADGKQYDKTKMKLFWEKVFTEEVMPKIKSQGSTVSQSDEAKAFIEGMNAGNADQEGED